MPDTDITLTVSDTSIVSISPNGTVKALKSGTTTVTAKTSNGKTAVCTITVNKAVPEKVTVSPASKTINVGNTLSLTAQITPSDVDDDKITWSSSNTSGVLLTSPCKRDGIEERIATSA